MTTSRGLAALQLAVMLIASACESNDASSATSAAPVRATTTSSSIAAQQDAMPPDSATTSSTPPLTTTTSTTLPSPTTTMRPSPDAQDLTTCFVSGGVEYGCWIDTWVGFGPPDIGDGRLATGAILQEPLGVFAAEDGSVFIADSRNNRIRQVTTDGIIHTVAGTGTAETQALGDGMPATEATVRFPQGMVVGPDGSLYIADTNHYVVRQVDSSGVIHTVAGDRRPFYGGDGGLATLASFGTLLSVAVDKEGNIYAVDSHDHRIRRISTDGIIDTVIGTGEPGMTGDGGRASNANIQRPWFLVVDRDREVLYFSQDDPAGSGFRIRSVDLDTMVISTVPTEPFGRPGFDVDADGNLIAWQGGRFLRVDPVTGATRVIATTSGTEVWSLSLGPDGTIYFTDPSRDLVLSIGPGDTSQRVFAGGGTVRTVGAADEVAIFDSQGLAFDEHGNLYFADFSHNTIRRLDTNGTVSVVAGTGEGRSDGDGGHPLRASFSQPVSLVFDPSGNLLFLDLTSSVGVVRLITPGTDGVVDGGSDETIRTIAGQVRPREDADHGNADGQPATEAVFVAARSICVDSASNLYVADAFDYRIRRINPGTDGVLNGGPGETIETVAGTGSNRSTGNGGQAAAASITEPNWLQCDPNSSDVYLHEGGSGSIRRIDSETGAINLFHKAPHHLSSFLLDPSGNLYYGEGTRTSPTRLVRVDAQTLQKEVVAGIREPGYSGDGGDALSAAFTSVAWLAADSNGDVYVADNGNFAIRKVTFVPIG